MQRKRYSFKDIGEGPFVTLSFRVPQVAKDMLNDRVEAAADLTNQSEALTDALVVWIMLEELEATKANGDREGTA